MFFDYATEAGAISDLIARPAASAPTAGAKRMNAAVGASLPIPSRRPAPTAAIAATTEAVAAS